MPGHDIIVIGASAGGVEALTELVGGLPPDLPAAVFVAVHVPADSRSALPDILSRSGPLPAAHAQDGEAIQQGRIYVAPPGRHLLVEQAVLRLSLAAQEHHTRPAADPLFRSAARAYGSRVVGVVLSGTLDDGTAGLIEISRLGGASIAQEPADALFPTMPRNAIARGHVQYILPPSAIATVLTELAWAASPLLRRTECEKDVRA